MPGYPEAHLYRGAALLYLGRSKEGLRAIEHALALRPDYLGAHSARGAVLAGLGRYKEGLKEIDRVLALRPDYPEAIYNKASAYSLLQEAQVALEWLVRAIKADQNYRVIARTDPHFPFLREHSELGPRFRVLVGK